MRINPKKALFALMIIGLILPLSYLTTISSTRTPVRDYQLTNAVSPQFSKAEAEQILATLGRILSTKDLNRLSHTLGGVSLLTSTNDPIGQYLNALSSYSDNLVNLQSGLSAANSALASGNKTKAEAELQQLVQLRKETESLRQSSYVLLEQLRVQYGVDTAAQANKVKELDLLFQEYSAQVDQLNAMLRTEQGSVKTTLTLNTTSQAVFVGENFLVYGYLREQNGTALTSRNITISWVVNQTITPTDFSGRFEAHVSFPIGSTAGLNRILANFYPNVLDSKTYLSSEAMLQINATYEPSKITGNISQDKFRRLDIANVTGSLTSIEDRPLASKLIAVQLDGAALGNTTTDSRGSVTFAFSIPMDMVNGTHNVTLTYSAAGERFAPSNITLPFTVEVIASQLVVSVDRASLLSGMRLSVNGNLTFGDGVVVSSSNVTVYLDNTPYTNVTVHDDGSFSLPVQLPFWLGFGAHHVRVAYSPSEPSVNGSEDSVNVFVYSTPVIIFAVAAIGASPTVVYVLRNRRRHAAVLLPPTIPAPIVTETPARQEYTAESLISALEGESLHAARIRKSYRLAQSIINQKIGESSRTGETHWEYFHRVASSLPSIKDTLERLVELFELAEYAPYPIENSQSREAREVLLELREEIENVK